jgi:hypothetical protein
MQSPGTGFDFTRKCRKYRHINPVHMSGPEVDRILKPDRIFDGLSPNPDLPNSDLWVTNSAGRLPIERTCPDPQRTGFDRVTRAFRLCGNPGIHTGRDPARGPTLRTPAHRVLGSLRARTECARKVPIPIQPQVRDLNKVSFWPRTEPNRSWRGNGEPDRLARMSREDQTGPESS